MTDPTTTAGQAPMVHFAGVSKWFGDLVAVSDVTFSIGTGVTALLGPNGAGKSTILRLLCGLARPSKGTVEVLGRDPKVDRMASRLVGLVPQQESMLEVLTAFEFVELAAVLHGVADPAGAAEQSLRVVELDPSDRRTLPAYSKGMKQRVKLAQALVHGPRVLVLDEPLTGLDPRQRIQMTEVIHQLGDEGRCVIVSSHVLEEVERFGSRVLVVAQGRMAAEGDFREIRALMDDRPLRVRLRSDRARRLVGGLIERGLVDGAHLDDESTAIVDTTDVTEFSRGVVTTARDADCTLYELQAVDDDLEAVFRYLVER